MGESLGERIQALRLEAGLSQTQLGERTGLGAPNVRNWEQNHRTPSVFALRKIARAVGRPVDDFLDGVDEEESPPTSRKGKADEGPAEGRGGGAKGQAGGGKGKGKGKTGERRAGT